MEEPHEHGLASDFAQEGEKGSLAEVLQEIAHAEDEEGGIEDVHGVSQVVHAAPDVQGAEGQVLAIVAAEEGDERKSQAEGDFGQAETAAV